MGNYFSARTPNIRLNWDDNCHEELGLELGLTLKILPRWFFKWCTWNLGRLHTCDTNICTVRFWRLELRITCTLQHTTPSSWLVEFFRWISVHSFASWILILQSRYQRSRDVSLPTCSNATDYCTIRHVDSACDYSDCMKGSPMDNWQCLFFSPKANLILIQIHIFFWLYSGRRYTLGTICNASTKYRHTDFLFLIANRWAWCLHLRGVT